MNREFRGKVMKLSTEDEGSPRQAPAKVAVKFDGGKPGVHLLPFDALLEVAKVYDFGANKYAARNWEKGMSYSRMFAACLRHLWAWWGGQRNDPEHGLHHLTSAAFCVLAMLSYELRKIGHDDRPNSHDGTI